MLGRTVSRILQGQATRDGGVFRIVPTDLPEADVTDEDAIDAVRERRDALLVGRRGDPLRGRDGG